MYICKGAKIRVLTDENRRFTGELKQTELWADENGIDIVLFLSQDRKYIEQEGEFGHVALNGQCISSLYILQNNYNTSTQTCQSSDVPFCDKLRKLRSDKGITQKEAAREIGTSESVYQRYEKNEAKPSYEQLIRLADYYDVSIDYLTGRT